MAADPFLGAGSLRDLYAATDWAATSLGPVESWSPTLVATVDLVLRTQFPATLYWGQDLVLVYNEAYVQLIADKHPAALGATAAQVFPEAWEQLGPQMRAALVGEKAVYLEDTEVPLLRRGFLEECYFSFSYSGVNGPDGVEGVLTIATESTRRVLDRRRLEILARLSTRLADVTSIPEMVDETTAVLADASADLPAVELRLPGMTGDVRLPGRPPVGWDGLAPRVVDDGEHGRVAWVPLTHAAAADDPAVVVARLSERLAPDEAYFGFLLLIAALLSQVLDRLTVRAAERDLSETLQRSLLSQPLEPDHLQVAVRYVPAAERAQIGGDWYDAFLSRDGALTIVVGDVAGHDRDAAAAMGQVRNLLRGVAWARDDPPAAVLGCLDEALLGLGVGSFATAVLAQIELQSSDSGTGLRTLRWCNAGHPPPVLLSPDGTATLLDAEPDLLLGLGAGLERSDHELLLAPGAIVVLYTDGLVERRTAPLDEGLAWLVDTLRGKQGLDAEAICDHLIGALPDVPEDDVVVLVLRAFPEDAPRPAVAGRQVLSADLVTP